MDKRDRERIGPFVVTRAKDMNPDGIDCAMCGKLLTQFDSATDLHIPSCEKIFAEGAVPIPNFGWFCSQACADIYEREFNVRLQRDAAGKVEYYPEGFS